MIGSNGSFSGHIQRASAGLTMPEIEPDDHSEMKRLLRPGTIQFCQNILDGIQNNERTAMNLFPRIMGAIGAEREININMATTHAFGMAATEVQAIIESHRQSSATSIEQCAEDGVALLKWCIEQEPQRLAGILAALGGGNALVLEAPDNGDTNGHA